jgi:hypothetical protein
MQLLIETCEFPNTPRRENGWRGRKLAPYIQSQPEPFVNHAAKLSSLIEGNRSRSKMNKNRLQRKPMMMRMSTRTV